MLKISDERKTISELGLGQKWRDIFCYKMKTFLSKTYYYLLSLLWPFQGLMQRWKGFFQL
jgi:hypothetical protein